MKTVLTIVGVIIVLALIGSAWGGDDPEPSYGASGTARSTTTTETDPAKQVSIIPGSLEVTGNSLGYMVLSGKVRNSGLTPLKFVKIRGYALSEGGATVNTDYGYIDSDILAPGKTSTFKILVDDPNEEATRGRVVVEGADYAR